MISEKLKDLSTEMGTSVEFLCICKTKSRTYTDMQTALLPTERLVCPALLC